MTYTKDGEIIRLEVTVEQFDQLLIIMGCAIRDRLDAADYRRAYCWLQLANDLNAGNPEFTPYEIPEKYRKPKPS